MLGRPSRKPFDLFFDFGTATSGAPKSRDDLYGMIVELREQYLSGMQSFAWSGGGSGSYITPDQAMLLLHKMVRKLGEIDGQDYGAGLGTIEATRIIPKDPWRYRGGSC